MRFTTLLNYYFSDWWCEIKFLLDYVFMWSLLFSYSNLRRETGGFELASTITLALQANRLTKCASHPKSELITMMPRLRGRHIQNTFKDFRWRIWWKHLLAFTDNHFLEALHLRCLTGFWIRLYILLWLKPRHLGSCLKLILSWWRSLSYRSQSTDLLCKSMKWFLYDRDLRHEKVNKCFAKAINRYLNVIVKFSIMDVRRNNKALQTHHVYSTLKRRPKDLFHIIIT